MTKKKTKKKKKTLRTHWKSALWFVWIVNNLSFSPIHFVCSFSVHQLNNILLCFYIQMRISWILFLLMMFVFTWVFFHSDEMCLAFFFTMHAFEFVGLLCRYCTFQMIFLMWKIYFMHFQMHRGVILSDLEFSRTFEMRRPSNFSKFPFKICVCVWVWTKVFDCIS